MLDIPPRHEARIKPAGRSYPRWVAPFLGAALGAYVALRRQSDLGPGPVSPLAMGAGIGFAGGLVVLLLDKPSRRADVDGLPDATGDGGESGLVGRFLAIASLLLAWAFVIAPILGAVAWYLNRKARGWPRAVSIAGTLISTVWTIVAMVVLTFGGV